MKQVEMKSVNTIRIFSGNGRKGKIWASWKAYGRSSNGLCTLGKTDEA